MKSLFTFSHVLFYLFFFTFTHVFSAQEIGNSKYKVSYNACNNCSHKTGNAIFYDDGGEQGQVSNQNTTTTFESNDGFILSFYFTEIDLPRGQK